MGMRMVGWPMNEGQAGLETRPSDVIGHAAGQPGTKIWRFATFGDLQHPIVDNLIEGYSWRAIS
jgi:hypothetical protein